MRSKKLPAVLALFSRDGKTIEIAFSSFPLLLFLSILHTRGRSGDWPSKTIALRSLPHRKQRALAASHVHSSQHFSKNRDKKNKQILLCALLINEMK